MTINFVAAAGTFEMFYDGVSQGTWTRVDEIDSDFTIKLHDTYAVITLNNPYESIQLNSTDTIQVGGVAVTGTFREKIATLKDDVFFLPAASGGGATTLQQAIDNGSTLNKDNEIISPDRYRLSDGNDATRKTYIDFQPDPLFPYVDIYAEKPNGEWSEVNVYPAALGLFCFNNTNSTVLDLTPTAATLTKNGVTKPIATVNYLVYTALLTQTGTAAPVATVLENTLGGTVVWSRSEAGWYYGTLAGVFTENKTLCPPFGIASTLLPLFNGKFYECGWNNGDRVGLYVYTDNTGNTNVDLGSGSILIEIRVYP